MSEPKRNESLQRQPESTVCKGARTAETQQDRDLEATADFHTKFTCFMDVFTDGEHDMVKRQAFLLKGTCSRLNLYHSQSGALFGENCIMF